MIQLFHINNHIIDTSEFSNLLHDDIVSEFENKFAQYVGAKYACSVNSATNAIFLSMLDKNTIDRIIELLEDIQDFVVGAWVCMILASIIAWYIRSI